jgi:hypothetical protein
MWWYTPAILATVVSINRKYEGQVVLGKSQILSPKTPEQKELEAWSEW